MAGKDVAVKKYVVRLSAEERSELEALIRKRKSPAQRLLKARILLKADVSDAGEGWSDSRIIRALDTNASGSRTLDLTAVGEEGRGARHRRSRQRQHNPSRKHSASLDSDIDLDRVLRSPHLRFTETVDESKAIAKLSGFHIIIAASGMCDAGRIRHHLKRWLWHSGATVLLVGFPAQGTLARFLDEGAKAVRIQGEEIKVAARIRRIDDYSGHADGPELARWIAMRRPIHRGVFLVHGEEPALAGLLARIAEHYVPEARIFRPVLDDSFDLSTAAPTPIDSTRRRRLAAAQVAALDWHNDMSELLLDINERIDAAADDRAKGVIIRRLRRALEAEG